VRRVVPFVVLVGLLAASGVSGGQTVLTEREIDVKGRYLLVPVNKKATANPFRSVANTLQQTLDVYVDGVLVHSPNVDLAHKKADIAFWGQLDLSGYVGKKARLRLRVLNDKAKRAVPAHSKALEMIDTGDTPRDIEPLYKERLRPLLHFSQMRGWNNDTNGMLYYDGEYHLFWQANPVGLQHGNMYWGHAVSTDLVHWKELPEALRPFAMGCKNAHPAMAIGRCHSGGGTVDHNNTGGWQTGRDKVLLLTFTDTTNTRGRQRNLPGFQESIAYSTDKGRSWRIWEGSPIIKHVGRDPKLFWYEKGNHRLIHGPVYAGQCFSNAPDGRVIYMGWVRGLTLPGMPITQGFTLPIELTLTETPAGVRMYGYPAKEVDTLRDELLYRSTGAMLAAGQTLEFATDREAADILLTVRPAPGARELNLRIGDTRIGYDFKTAKTLPFSGNRKRKKQGDAAPVALRDGKLYLRVVVDRSTAEVFYNNGEVYALRKRNTPRIGTVTLEAEGMIVDFRAYGMKSIWQRPGVESHPSAARARRPRGPHPPRPAGAPARASTNAGDVPESPLSRLLGRAVRP